MHSVTSEIIFPTRLDSFLAIGLELYSGGSNYLLLCQCKGAHYCVADCVCVCEHYCRCIRLPRLGSRAAAGDNSPTPSLLNIFISLQDPPHISIVSARRIWKKRGCWVLAQYIIRQ